MPDVRSFAFKGVRWSARILSTLLGIALLMFIVGEGPPPFYVLAPWLVVLAGFALGWRYDGPAAAMILAGFVYFNAMELRANGCLLRFGAFHLLLIPTALFMIAWCERRFRRLPGTAGKA